MLHFELISRWWMMAEKRAIEKKGDVYLGIHKQLIDSCIWIYNRKKTALDSYKSLCISEKSFELFKIFRVQSFHSFNLIFVLLPIICNSIRAIIDNVQKIFYLEFIELSAPRSGAYLKHSIHDSDSLHTNKIDVSIDAIKLCAKFYL